MPELGTRYRKQAAGTRGGAPELKGGHSQIGGAPRVAVLHPRLPFIRRPHSPGAQRAANTAAAVSPLWVSLWLKRVTDPQQPSSTASPLRNSIGSSQLQSSPWSQLRPLLRLHAAQFLPLLNLLLVFPSHLSYP